MDRTPINKQFDVLLATVAEDYHISTEYNKDITSGIEFATNALKQTWINRYRPYTQSGSGTIWYPSTQRDAVSALTGSIGLLNFGHMLASLAGRVLAGRKVLDILGSVNVTGTYKICNVGPVTYPSANRGAFIAITGADNALPKDGLQAQKMVYTCMTDLVNYVAEDRIENFAKQSDFLATVKLCIAVLSSISLQDQDYTITSAILLRLNDFFRPTYLMWYAGGASMTRELKYETLDTLKALQDHSYLMECFKKYHAAKREIKIQTALLETMKLFVNNVVVEEGRMRISLDVIKSVIERTVTDPIHDSMAELNFNQNFSDYAASVLRAARCSKILRNVANDKKVETLPKEYDAVIPLLPYHEASLSDCEKVVGEFKGLYSAIYDDEFVEFINLISTARDGYWFPNVATRVAPIDGIQTVYRLDFTDKYIEKVYLFNAEHHSTYDTSELVASLPLQITPQKSFTDKIALDHYKVDSQRGFYGAFDVDAEEEKFFIEQFKWLSMETMTDGGIDMNLKSVVYTIKPPKYGVRELDFLTSTGTKRVVNSAEYEIEQVSGLTSGSFDVLDIIFAYREFEVNDRAKFADLYQARVRSLFGNRVQRGQQLFSKGIQPAPILDANVENFGLLLAFNGLAGQIGNTVHLQPDPLNLDAKTIYADGVDVHEELPRIISFDFPIKKSSVNVTYITNLKLNDTVTTKGGKSVKRLYHSKVYRRRKSMFQIFEEDFSSLFSDCYRARITVDLRLDASITDVARLERTTDKMLIWLKPFFAAFEDKNKAVFYDHMAIYDQDGNVIKDWRTLTEQASQIYPRSGESDDNITAAIAGFIQNAMLEYFDENNPHFGISELITSLTDISDWVKGRLNVNNSTSLSAFLPRVVGGTVADLTSLNNTCVDKDVIDLFKKLFGLSEVALGQLPVWRIGNYKTLLDAVLYNKWSYKGSVPKIGLNHFEIPSYLIRDPENVVKIAQMFFGRYMMRNYDFLVS